MTRTIRWATVLLIECLVCGYRVALAPLLVGSCKFHPTCSEYFLEAVRQWGPRRGVWLGVKRLARCRPFGPGGLDPVPANPRANDDGVADRTYRPS